MTDSELAELISDALRNGITHPGNGREQKPKPIALPFGGTPTMPEPMKQLLNASTKLLGEAIIHLLKTKGKVEFINRDEAKVMRRAVGDMPARGPMTPVYCRCDVKHERPLTSLSVADPEQIVVDGPSLLRVLHGKAIECPHGAIT